MTVMPCFDKKLEAVRDDFVFEVESQNSNKEKEAFRISEVDSVLTSGEVLDLIQVSKLIKLYILFPLPLSSLLIAFSLNCS